MNRLKDKYLNETKQKLKEEFKLSSDFAVPKLQKVVINIGVGEGKDHEDLLKTNKENLTALSGQLPIITKAKKSISSFKLTAGAPIGVMVTLRGERMYSFVDKLINAVLPKVRDFRGVNEHAFDSRGNFNLGLREQVIFPEVDQRLSNIGYKSTDRGRGLQVTIITTAKNLDQGKRLLELLGMPFRQI